LILFPFVIKGKKEKEIKTELTKQNQNVQFYQASGRLNWTKSIQFQTLQPQSC